MTSELTLVSHPLCPYVQRAAIALAEKGVGFERTFIDLADKPDWFLEISPFGKVPLLQVGRAGSSGVVFESAVIVEYLEETQPNPLHPGEALERARHRGWIEFASDLLNLIVGLYNAKTEEDFREKQKKLREGFVRLEKDLEARGAGPFFAGLEFSLVDAAFGPVYRYFDTFEQQAGLYMLDGLPRLAEWRSKLASRPSIMNAVSENYPELLTGFLLKRKSYLASLISGFAAKP